MNQLAVIDIAQEDYKAANEKLVRSIEIRRSIGDLAGEAATLHNVASIDIEEKRHQPAREKLLRALQIQQSIGKPDGEAATMYQLGLLAHGLGRGHIAARLLAICYLINLGIEHGYARGDFRQLSALCSELGYDQVQFDAMLAEAAAEYQTDRGWGLIERAFDEDPQP